MRILLTLLLLALTATSGHAAARKVMIIGDSQSEEYAFESGPSPGFSGPDSDQFNANIVNWVEIIAAERATEMSFGSYNPNYLGYSDLRNGGYAYNWSVPGFETGQWVDVIESSIFNNQLFLTSKFQMIDQMQDEVEYVVVFLGANDVRGNYGDFYDNTLPSGFLTGIVNNLKTLVDFIKEQKSSLRIVLVNIPDPGVTPTKIEDHPDAARRNAASAIIATLNNNIAALAAAENCALADVFALTELIRSTQPFYVNGTEFIKDGHPENLPRYIFAKDGFHPASMAQAFFANAIITAINSKWSQNIPLLPNREILGSVVGLNPDQPLLDWLASKGVASGTFTDDPDGDGISHGMEFALDTHPGQPDGKSGAVSQEFRSGVASLVLRQFGTSTRDGYLVLSAQESPSLIPATWTNVPSNRFIDFGNGTIETWMPITSSSGFLRLIANPAP